MKKTIALLLVIFSVSIHAQNKKLEALHNQTGKTTVFEPGTRVKITTLDRKKLVGFLTVKDAETISVNNTDVALSNIGSIRNYSKGGRKAKNILYGVGAGLIAGSGVAGLAKSGSAFSLFMGGTATAITGAFVNNKHKNIVYRNHIFKVVD
jgi:hypothetical protein